MNIGFEDRVVKKSSSYYPLELLKICDYHCIYFNLTLGIKIHILSLFCIRHKNDMEKSKN